MNQVYCYVSLLNEFKLRSDDLCLNFDPFARTFENIYNRVVYIHGISYQNFGQGKMIGFFGIIRLVS